MASDKAIAISPLVVSSDLPINFSIFLRSFSYRFSKESSLTMSFSPARFCL
jgi:hypothetical protein